MVWEEGSYVGIMCECADLSMDTVAFIKSGGLFRRLHNVEKSE